MCKILILPPKFTLPKDMLTNAVYNNPHGYGLVLRDPENNKIQVIRKCPEENDPEEIYNLLKDNEDIERYLHLRWRTEGSIDIDNTHPFNSYHSSKRDVVFMHNGTLYEYSPKKRETWINGRKIETPDSDDTSSDSKRFNEEVIVPLLLRTKGDVLDSFNKMVISKFFGTGSHNKGLLVSSDQGAVLISPENWKKLTIDGVEFYASNDSYFKDVTRGPEFERRQEKKKKEEAETRRRRFLDANDDPFVGSNTGWPLTELKEIDLKKHISLTDDVRKLLNDVDVWSQEGIAALANMTDAEWKTFVQNNPDDAIALIGHITEEYSDLLKKYNKATSYIKRINVKDNTGTFPVHEQRVG